MRTPSQDVMQYFMLLAFFLALASPRWWIAMLGGVACSFAIMPWVLLVWPGGTPISALADGHAIATMLVGGFSSLLEGLVYAIIGYGGKRAIGALVGQVTKKSPMTGEKE